MKISTKLITMSALFVAAMAVQAGVVTGSAADGYLYDTSDPYDGLGDFVNNKDQKNHFVGDISSQMRRSFLNFDLPINDGVNPIDEGADVTNATLRLYYFDVSYDDSLTVSIFHNTVSSTELAVSDFQSTAWADTGLGFASDTDDVDSGWLEFDVTSFVKGSLDSGAGNIASFRLQIDGDLSLGTDQRMVFRGAATTDNDRYPELVIETIPEPATLGLVASVGGVLFWIRRRFMM